MMQKIEYIIRIIIGISLLVFSIIKLADVFIVFIILPILFILHSLISYKWLKNWQHDRLIKILLDATFYPLFIIFLKVDLFVAYIASVIFMRQLPKIQFFSYITIFSVSYFIATVLTYSLNYLFCLLKIIMLILHH